MDDGGATELTGPGGAFEIVQEPVLGEAMAVFRHRPRSARELLIESGRFGTEEYVIDPRRRLGFSDHLEDVAAFATVLRDEYGVRPGDRVALLAANSSDWIIAFWATVSLGAIAASMNAWWAEPEVGAALTSCDPTVLIADSERIAKIPNGLRGALPTIGVETDFGEALASTRGAPMPAQPIDEDHDAVILYTSGTTGSPKGAVATHRGICGCVTLSRYSAARAAALMGTKAAVGSRQIALVTVPLFHASGLYGFVVNQLASGGSIVLTEGRFDEDGVIAVIEAEQVSMWAALGSMGPRVASRVGEIGGDLSSVRLLAVGGAPVSPTAQAQLRAAFPNASLNISMGYTSSEAVAVVTRIQGEELRMHPTSAGSPLATTEIEIRDNDGQPVADGVDGEIHVRSPYLMKEYWRDPVATEAVLRPGRWLAMGDVGHMADGRLYIDSRARDMILVNAENVFPTEIEYRLDAHPDVLECAVLGVEDDSTGQAIRAVVVVDRSSGIRDEDLTTWCRAALAGYKVPTQWDIRFDRLPRNASGKILKRELGA